MSEKRYQVFVSSTFRDLLEERQSVLEAILHLRHIPAGMEIFPAADSTPWDLIKSIIQDSDYYVLIIGGRYGSVDPDGVSYTEREYDLALELGKPVLAFIHAEPDSLPLTKNETERKARRKLDAFRKRVERHMCKYWRDTAALRTEVIIALTWAIQTHPSVGWVRAIGYDDVNLLKRLADLQERFDLVHQENASLLERLGANTNASHLSQGAEKTEITFYFGRYTDRDDEGPTNRVVLSWDEIFFGIGMELVAAAREWDLQATLSSVIFGVFSGTPEFQALTPYGADPGAYRDQCYATRKSIDMILKQFAALGLIEPQLVSRTLTDKVGKTYSTLEDAWRLTTKGRDKYFSAVAVPRKEGGPDTDEPAI